MIKWMTSLLPCYHTVLKSKWYFLVNFGFMTKTEPSPWQLSNLNTLMKTEILLKAWKPWPVKKDRPCSTYRNLIWIGDCLCTSPLTHFKVFSVYENKAHCRTKAEPQQINSVTDQTAWLQQYLGPISTSFSPLPSVRFGFSDSGSACRGGRNNQRRTSLCSTLRLSHPAAESKKTGFVEVENRAKGLKETGNLKVHNWCICMASLSTLLIPTGLNC